MGRLMGRGKPDATSEYNEIVAEIKKEHPYIGPVALKQEVMKRIAQRRAAKNQDGNNNNQSLQSGEKEEFEFAPQRILFNRKPNKHPQRQGVGSSSSSNNSNLTTSLTQSINKSFIDFLSSSTTSYNTVKTSNITGSIATVMPGRRTSTFVEAEDEAAVIMAARAMRDIELSDSEEDETSDNNETDRTTSRRSSGGNRLSSLKRIPSLKGKIRKRYSSKSKQQHRRSSSTNSSITANSLQDISSSITENGLQDSSDFSKDSVEKSVESSRTDNDNDEKPQHKSVQNNTDNSSSNNNSSSSKDHGKVQEEEEEIMDFVDKFLANGGSVKPKTENRRASSKARRSSLCSVEENKALVTSGESVSRSMTSLGSKSSTVDTISRTGDDSLICSWGRRSMNDSELIGDGGELICNWDSRRSILSSSSAASTDAAVITTPTTDAPRYPREINVKGVDR